MKKIILGLVISFLSVSSFGQTKISFEDASKHYGERVTF